MSEPATPPGSAALRPRKPTRRERARRIRRLAVTWTVVAFVAAWGLLYVQLRDGNDPALGTTTSAATSTAVQDTTAADATVTDTTAADDGTSSSSPADVTSSSAATDQPAAATTSQS